MKDKIFKLIRDMSTGVSLVLAIDAWNKSEGYAEIESKRLIISSLEEARSDKRTLERALSAAQDNQFYYRENQTYLEVSAKNLNIEFTKFKNINQEIITVKSDISLTKDPKIIATLKKQLEDLESEQAVVARKSLDYVDEVYTKIRASIDINDKYLGSSSSQIEADDASSSSITQANPIPYTEEANSSAIQKSPLTKAELESIDLDEVKATPKESSIIDIDSINDLITNYKEFLSTLNGEQLACLSNTIGFIMIFFAMLTITAMLIGEYLINLLKLKTRFPRLAKYIEYKKKVDKFYLIYNIIFIYVIIGLLVSVNIYMFFR